MRTLWVTLGMWGLGAALLLGACNSEPSFGPECRYGDCPQMRDITDELVDQAEAVWEFGTTPGQIARPDQARRVAFAGRIPDGSPAGMFEIEGRAGDVITVQLYSRGLDEPTFSVTYGEEFERWSPKTSGVGTARQTIVLPYDGTYRLRVFERTYEEPDPEFHHTYSRPTDFAGYVAWGALFPPDALKVGGDTRERVLAEAEHDVFTIDGIDRGPVGVWVDGFTSGGESATRLSLTMGALSDPSLGSLRYKAMARRHKSFLRAVIDPSLGHQVHVGAASSYGPNMMVRVGAKTLSTLEPGASLDARVDVKAGQFVVAEHVNWELEPASVELSLAGEVVEAQNALPSGGLQAYVEESATLWRYLDEDVEASAQLSPTGDALLYEASLGLSVKEPLRTWSVVTDQSAFAFKHRELMRAKRSEFVVIQTDRPVVLAYKVNSIVGDNYQGSSRPVHFQKRVFSLENPTQQLPEVPSGDGLTGLMGGYEVTLQPGRYVLQIEPIHEADGGMEVLLSARVPSRD